MEPRYTPFMQDQARQLRQAFEQMWRDATLLAAWQDTVRAWRATMAHAARYTFPLTLDQSIALWRQSETDRVAYIACIHRFLDLLPHHAPLGAHALGAHAYEWFGRYFLQPFEQEFPQLRELHLERFLPDNPITLDKDGKLSHFLQASPAHRAQLMAYAASVEPVKPGRPLGSGTYATAKDFLQTVCPIISRLRQAGHYPSQHTVAKILPTQTDARQLRAWLKHFGMSWPDVLSHS